VWQPLVTTLIFDVRSCCSILSVVMMMASDENRSTESRGGVDLTITTKFQQDN